MESYDLYSNYGDWVNYYLPPVYNETNSTDEYYYDYDPYGYQNDTVQYLNRSDCPADTLASEYEYSLQYYYDNYPEYIEYLNGYERYFNDMGLNICDSNSFNSAYEEMENNNYDFYCKYFGYYCEEVSTGFSQMRAQVKHNQPGRFLAQLKFHASHKRQ